MHITIYLGDHLGDIVNATTIEKGNPGIGGTQYCMLLLAHYLKKYGDYEVSVIGHREYILEPGIELITDCDRTCVVQRSEEIGTDILIVKNFVDKQFEKAIKNSVLKVIVWSHNYIYSDFCRFISTASQVKANIFVGKQQYDSYIDDDVIEKSLTIYNMYPDYFKLKEKQKKRKIVVFMGSISEGKGFYEMARIWHGVVRDVPDAELIVLGNGCLYGTQKLGPLGIAEEHYENKLRPLICDKEGKILPSIHFKGLVGEEKNAIFQEACIGVINPSKNRETFGMGILEMASVGLPVVTIGKTGYFDTIKNNETGILCGNLCELQRSIVASLQSMNEMKDMGSNAKVFIRKFSPEVIIESWVSLLECVYYDTLKIEYNDPIPPYSSQFKWLRILNRFLRLNCKIKIIPSVVQLETFVQKVRRLF